MNSSVFGADAIQPTVSMFLVIKEHVTQQFGSLIFCNIWSTMELCCPEEYVVRLSYIVNGINSFIFILYLLPQIFTKSTRVLICG